MIAVNTTITKGKTKRFRGRMGTRKEIKNAYVTLEQVNSIDVSTDIWGYWDNPRQTKW